MRYLPLSKSSRREMLDAIGAQNIQTLYKGIPASAIFQGEMDIPLHKGEIEVEQILSSLASRNRTAGEGPFFLGAGCYHHHIPASVDYIIQRSEFLTAYTPYQPEIAQGTLTAIYEFQTSIARLTGQEIANASLYDGATALSEAALMSLRINKNRHRIAIANDLHPHYRAVLETYMNQAGVEIIDGGPDPDCACLIVQSPDFHGTPHSYEKYRSLCDESGSLLIVVVTEILSLGLLPAPDCADVVCGEAQSIGLPMNFGGPHLGFFASQKKFMRQMPGRLVGETTDKEGRRSFVLTLNAREQHIKREKATSNICTNQGLCALAFTVHLALLGEDGYKQLALLNHEKACRLASALTSLEGVRLVTPTFFNELTIEFPYTADDISAELLDKGIIGGYCQGREMILAATELTSEEDIKALQKALADILADRYSRKPGHRSPSRQKPEACKEN